MPKPWNIKRFLGIDSKPVPEKDIGNMNRMNDKTSFTNSEKEGGGNGTHVTNLNGQVKLAPLSFKTSAREYDGWTSSTGTSPSSCTVSSNSNSIENGNSPHVLLTDRLAANQTYSASLSGDDRKKFEKLNRNRAEENDATKTDVSEETAASHGAKTECANIGDYVENALISSNASLSPDSNKLFSDTHRSPRLSSFQSFSTLNQEANGINHKSNLEMKPDFVTLDFVKSAVNSERRSKADANNTDSCSSSLSSSFMSSIASEDGSSIDSDVVENLRNKIAAAAAKHKLKSSNASPADQKYGYLKTDYKNENTEQSYLNKALADDFPPPPTLQDRCNKCGGIIGPFGLRDDEENAGSPDSFGHCQCNANDGTDEVTEIDLSNSNLKTVPDYVQEYASTLVKLSLESNAIVDLPKELFSCGRLRELLIGDNDIAKLPANLAGLTDLKHLDISKNVIEDIPDCMPCLKNLKILDASVNPIEILSEEFTRLISLQELYMNDCFFDYLPASFGRLSELRVLELRDNQLQILPKSIRRLLNLERLDLGGNVLQDWPDVISKLINLRELWLDGNELNKVSIDIGQLLQLTYLDLSKNLLTTVPNQIGSLELVTDLLLAENNITSLPESIGFMRCLTSLNIEHNQIEKLPDSIGKLRLLAELDASHNNLKELPSSVKALRNLQLLLLDDNHLTELPREIGDCVSMSVLQLSQNRIEALPDSLGNLESLRVLNISQNRIRHLPITLKNLTQLEALWISPNQSKPSVPVHVEFDPADGRQVLTNLLFPQERDGLSRVSKVLGACKDDDDSDKFAIDAADDDDLEAYSRRERGKSQVVFDLSLTTYSEAADDDDDDFDVEAEKENSELKPSREDSSEYIIDVDIKELKKNNISQTSDLPEDSRIDDGDHSLDQFAIDIPKNKELTGLVVSPSLDSTNNFKPNRLTVISEKPVIDDQNGYDVEARLPVYVGEIEKKKDNFAVRSLPDLDFIDDESSVDDDLQKTDESKAFTSDSQNPVAVSKSDLQSRQAVEAFASRRLSQKDILESSEACDSASSQPEHSVDSKTSEPGKPQVPTKPSKLCNQEFHASLESSGDKQPTNKLSSVCFASLSEEVKGQGVADRLNDTKIENEHFDETFRSDANDLEVANGTNANNSKFNQVVPNVITDDASRKLAFIDSDSKVISTPVRSEVDPILNANPNRYLMTTKPSSITLEESIPPPDDSEAKINDVEAQDIDEKRSGVNIAPTSSGETRFKVSWKSTSSVVKPAAFQPNQISASVNCTKEPQENKESNTESIKHGDDFAKKPTPKITDSTIKLQSVDENFSKPPKPVVPPPVPKKSSVFHSIKKFEKRFESETVAPAQKEKSKQSCDLTQQHSNSPLSHSKSSIEAASKSKPMAIATILSPAKTSSKPDLSPVQTAVSKPDIDDVMIANDVLKSLDLYTKGKEIQRKTPPNDSDANVTDENGVAKMTNESSGEKKTGEKRQSYGRKSKFDEALAATKHKHFREKLEKAMQLQQRNSAGNSLRQLSRGSTSSIAGIPRITSPIPQNYGFISDRMKPNEEEPGISQSNKSTSLKGNSPRVQSAGDYNKSNVLSKQTSTDVTFAKRGSTLRSSLRNSSRIQSDTNMTTSKTSLEEQLGQLLLDGSSASSSDHRGFVPYLPDEYCLSTSTRSIKRSSSSKDKPDSSGDLHSNNSRRAARPDDWRNQLLEYLEKKKKEKNKNPNQGKPANNISRSSKQFANSQSPNYASAIPQKSVSNYPSVKLESKNGARALAAAAGRSAQQPKQSIQTRKNNLTSSKPEKKLVPKQYASADEALGNFERNTSQRSSGRRSSSKYQRTRTPGPEIMSTEPKVKDLMTRSKSAMDQPISSELTDIYAADTYRKEDLPPKDNFYKVHPYFPSAPPTYEDHILRQMKAGTYSGDHQTYVNLEQLRERLRASAKQKEQQNRTNQTPSIHHVTSNPGQTRDLSAKPSATRDHFVNKQESKTRSENSLRAPAHNFLPVNHQSRVQYTLQQPYNAQPLQKGGYYVERPAFPADQYQPLYDDLSRVPSRYQHGDYTNKYVGQLPSSRSSNPINFTPQPIEMDGRLVKNQTIYKDPYYLPDQRNHRHPSSFLLPPENNSPHHRSYQYSNPYPDDYADNDESTLSAFRPYQHQQTNPTRRSQPPQPTYNSHYLANPAHHIDDRHYYPPKSSMSGPHQHQDYHQKEGYYQYLAGDVGGYTQEHLPLEFSPGQFDTGLKMSSSDDLHHAFHEIHDFGVEHVTVTVRKNPNFGFHIMGGVDAGGNPYRPDDEGVFVTYVAPGGSAEGLVKPGDKILMVNGSDFVGISHQRAVDLLKNAGQAAVLVVERVVGRPV